MIRILHAITLSSVIQIVKRSFRLFFEKNSSVELITSDENYAIAKSNLNINIPVEAYSKTYFLDGPNK